MKLKLQLFICVICVSLLCVPASVAQKTAPQKTPRSHASISPETNALINDAIGIVCTQAKLDPQSSVAIDEMQARPSLPVQSPEAQAGAERAERLLPLAKALMISSLRQLTAEYGFNKSAR